MGSKLKWSFHALCALLLFAAAPAWAQNGTITGTVRDVSTGQAVANAKVDALTAEGRTAATGLTNAEGRYRLTVPAGSYQVSVEMVGYEALRLPSVNVSAGGTQTVDATLRTSAFALDPVIVSASRRQERATEAPARVEVVTEADIRARPAVTAIDHLRSVPGVDVITQGVQGTNVTTRGFNNIFSGSLHMLTDHRLAGVPSLRVNVPYFVPTTNEDIERMEVVLGPGAALYGPNTASGVLHMLTKSPLRYQGTTVSVMGGEQSLFMGTIRTAHRLGERVGVKLSGQMMRAEEWEFVDPDEVAERAKFAEDPFFRQDLINSTGISPEEADRRIATIGERDNDVSRFSGEARLDWQVTDELTTVFQGGVSNVGSAVELTGLGAGQVDDWKYSYGQVRASWKRLFAQAYLNVSDAGDTYLLRTGQPIVDKSRLFVAQAQHGFDLKGWQSFTYGVDYFHTDPRTEGTINGRYEDDDETTEVGAYLQSQTAVTPKIDVVLAGRVDDHSALPEAIFSPRAALVFKPVEGQAFRATYNRAFSTPTSLNQFLDLPTSMPNQAGDINNRNAARLGYSVRVQGTGTTGFNFVQSDGSYRMRSPFAPALGIGPTSTLLPVNAASFFPAAVGVLAAQGVFNTNPQLGQYLSTLRPTAADISTNFIAEGQSFPIAGLNLQPVAPIRETTTTSYEIGYKGVLRERFSIAADVWKSEIDNFVTPLTVQTPLIALNGQATAAYLAARFMQDLGMPQAQAVATATQLATGLAQVPVGVISSAEISGGAQLLATYTNVNETLDMWGADVSVQTLLTDSWSVTVGGSYVSEDHFDTSVGLVTLNAPKLKGTAAVEYRNPDGGLNGELRARWNDEFPVRSGVYEGYSCVDTDNATAGECVQSYTLIDAVLGYTLRQFEGASVQLAVQNLFDQDYRSFPGVPNVGRMALLRLRYEF